MSIPSFGLIIPRSGASIPDGAAEPGDDEIIRLDLARVRHL